MADAGKRSWIVRMECKVIKDVIVEDCTIEEAWDEPWDHAVDEQEVEQYDWHVRNVTPNV